MFRIKGNLVETNMIAVRATVVLVTVLVATVVEYGINYPLSIIITLSTINEQLKKR
jgi:hypothetical protein